MKCIAQVESAGAELEELREMKEDVERRERAQATVIENQAKRLDELETLYKVRFLGSPHFRSLFKLDLSGIQDALVIALRSDWVSELETLCKAHLKLQRLK